MGFEDTRAGSNHKVKYSSGEADDTACEHVDPNSVKKHSPDNWSSEGPRDLNQLMALKAIGQHNFKWMGHCGAAPCVPRVHNSVCNYYFCARLCVSQSPAADLLR